MITISLITTFSKEGYRKYGRKNLESFLKLWPKDINYHVYVDFELDIKDSRIIVHDINKECPGLVSLKERHKDRKDLKGEKNLLIPKKGKIPVKYNYLYDYVKFAHKSFVMFSAIENIPTDWIIWLDGDTITHNTITYDLFEKILPSKALVVYLGREHIKMHTETGFLAFNKKHPRINDYLNIAKSIYEKDLILVENYFEKNGYTDCQVFDYTKEKLSKEGVTFFNLGKDLKGKHPFVNSILGEYMDHLKGDKRKNSGKSHRSDIREMERLKNKYWATIK